MFGSGKKSSKTKTLKKAAMIGGGAYVGYQLGKATGRFGGWHHGGGWGWNQELLLCMQFPYFLEILFFFHQISLGYV